MTKTIMIVDDDPSIRYSLGRLLEAKGYQTKKVYSGRECMTEVGKMKGNIDLILLDIMMPDVDGITTFYSIKKVYPDIKIIFLSAVQPDEEAKKILRGEGHIPNITKPFDYPKIIETIKEVLGE
jgi:two-component system cell cycle sensor histidine kinase/response regulator CckA